MVFLSAKVVCEGVGRELLSWEIIEGHLERITICEFFCIILLPRFGLFESANEPEKPQK